MRWFKHDVDANTDAKLKRVKIKYGMEGYGLYWYCLELIAAEVSPENITFELEHDSEIIAHDTGINYERVQEMISYMVKQKLFENSNGVITCLKLAKRLDQSMTSNPHMRQIIKQLGESGKLLLKQNHDPVMTQSEENHDPVSESSDQTRLDKTRLDKNNHIRENKFPPYDEIIERYHKILPNNPEVVKLTAKRKAHIKARWVSDLTTLEQWENYFSAVSGVKFLTGLSPPGKDRTKPFIANIDFLIREDILVKIAEGFYKD